MSLSLDGYFKSVSIKSSPWNTLKVNPILSRFVLTLSNIKAESDCVTYH